MCQRHMLPVNMLIDCGLACFAPEAGERSDKLARKLLNTIYPFFDQPELAGEI